MHLQSVAAKAGFFGFLLAALVAATAVGGTRLGVWTVGTGYRIMAPAAIVAALAFAAALVWLVLALKHNSGEGKRIGLVGLIGAGLLLYGPAGFVYRSLTMPAISDVATDPQHPPQFVALSAVAAPPHDLGRKFRFHGELLTAASLLYNEYASITRPVAFLMPTAKLFWRGFESAKAMGWDIVAVDAGDGRIEAVATSPWFARKADIVIRVRQAGTLGARLDIRCDARDRVADAGLAIVCVRNYLDELRSRSR